MTPKEPRVWDGVGPVYSNSSEMFLSASQVHDLWLSGESIDAMELELCERYHYTHQDPYDLFGEDVPEGDDELPPEVIAAVETLNDAVSKLEPPGWEPSGHPAILIAEGLRIHGTTVSGVVQGVYEVPDVSQMDFVPGNYSTSIHWEATNKEPSK